MISGSNKNIEYKKDDIVVYTGYDSKYEGMTRRNTTPPIFKIIKVDDLSRAWYGDDCIGTGNIRLANELEIEWFNKITNPRKEKLENLNTVNIK